MNDAELIAAAESIARPCVHLKRWGPGDGLAGVWGGTGVGNAPSGPYRHWLSVDCRFLPDGHYPRTGVLSVYTNEDDCVSGIAVHSASAELPKRAAQLLYAHKEMSLPPPDAFPDGDSDSYMRVWQSNCPLYTEEAEAVLGGWHFPWPDGDWEALREQSLLVWTIAESEPWVEVWSCKSGFNVRQRIT